MHAPSYTLFSDTDITIPLSLQHQTLTSIIPTLLAGSQHSKSCARRNGVPVTEAAPLA